MFPSHWLCHPPLTWSMKSKQGLHSLNFPLKRKLSLNLQTRLSPTSYPLILLIHIPEKVSTSMCPLLLHTSVLSFPSGSVCPETHEDAHTALGGTPDDSEAFRKVFTGWTRVKDAGRGNRVLPFGDGSALASSCLLCVCLLLQ